MQGRRRSNSAGSTRERNREDKRSLLAMVWIRCVWGRLSIEEEKKGVEGKKAVSSSFKSGSAAGQVQAGQFEVERKVNRRASSRWLELSLQHGSKSCPHFRCSTSKGFGDCHPSSYSWPLTTVPLDNTDEEVLPLKERWRPIYNTYIHTHREREGAEY